MANEPSNATNPAKEANVTDVRSNFDRAFELDVAIAELVGDAPFGEDGLRSTSHLSRVARRRVTSLRRERDALLEGARQ